MSNYNELEYPKDEFGENDFPQTLVDYLVERYSFRGGQTLLDVGCGKGFYANAFGRQGIVASGLDTKDCDFEEDLFPVASESYDYIFTKSTLEHIANLDNVLREMGRVLKPNGLVICIVPDWHSQWKTFYDDITHKTPFTLKSLRQAFLLADFKNVKCERFTMLRLTIEHPWLKWLPPLIRLLVPDWFKRFRVIRFSKERMLLLTATTK